MRSVGDETGWVTGLTRWKALTVPVALAVDDSLQLAWQHVTSTPLLVLVGRDGLVAGLVQDPFSRADLRAMYEALERGSPIPTPAPSAQADGERAGGGTDSLLMPHRRAQAMDGSVFDSSSLLGRPAVLFFVVSDDQPAIDRSRDELDALRQASAGAANFLVVGQFEREPGAMAAAWAARGLSVPFVIDWDSALYRAFNVEGLETIVLDGEGRFVVGYGHVSSRPELDGALEVAGG